MDNGTAETIAEATGLAAGQGRPAEPREPASVFAIRSRTRERDSLSENFNDELEAWARHSLGANGFGDTPEEDAKLARELLDSAKDRHEQQLVVESIQRRLHRSVANLHIPDPKIYPLHNIQHLNTPIIGLLREPEGVLPLVERLHPTPALGGTPRRAALEFLRETEPVPRGWYGAPVGWIDHTLDGKFAVAIRSAVTQNSRVWMYAGAGVVADSVPKMEWEETELKFRPMVEALGIGN